jgi:YidC/Oxa1 family membrane protein insertase
MTVLAGLLSPIEDVLTAVLEWLHSSIGFSWAWAIVAVTVMVRIVILPLTIKQIRSMQRLQQYAPELKALQQKYKNDRQRMNEEVMKFYREHKVNPAASCLPILPQIPIFISLFYVLRDFEKEVFPQYPTSSLEFLNGLVPNITQNVNEHWSGWLLLVIYVASQLLSLILSTTTIQSRGQRYVLLALPFIFIPFIINFPVGLMIYWVTTNLWTVGQGGITRRLYPKPVMETPKRTSRTASKKASDAAQPGQPKTASAAAPQQKPATSDGASQPRPVRRRKKKGPRSRR